MLNKKEALLLIGSPKIKNSTSELLGNYLIEKLNKQGYTAEKVHISSILKNDSEKLLNKVNNASIIIISFPLYEDALPSQLVKALELIGEDRRKKKIEKKQSLMTIINCGFPEAFQNQTAIEICKNFADKNDFKWLGGLATGSGGLIDVFHLNKLGFTRNTVKALDKAAEDISKENIISEKTIRIMAKDLLPRWMYILSGNINWKIRAKKHNVDKQICARPYIRD